MEQDAATLVNQPPGGARAAVAGTGEGGSCSSCAARAAQSTPQYIYALGRVEPRFPRLSVEKEYAQATGRAETAGLTDREALHKVLSARHNRYLLKQLCWAFTIGEMDAYLLQPRDPVDFDLLLETIRPAPHAADIDVVVGVRGPVAPAEYCNGVMVPLVGFSQLYSFDVDSFVKAVPRPPEANEKDFPRATAEIFSRVRQMAENLGASDAHRAVNYLVLRYPAIYAKAAEEFALDFSLTAVDARPSLVTNTRKVVEVIFTYTNRKSDFSEKYSARVDVTEEFPFLVGKLSPYYDR